MNSGAIIFGILPLVIFVVVDSFSSLKAALIAASVFALLEAVFGIVKFGTIDAVTATSILLVIVLSFISYKKNNEKIFLFQPVILSTFFGITLFVTYLMGHPLMFEMAKKYKEFLPDAIQVQLSSPVYQEILIHVSWTLGFSFLIHAGITAWAALKLNKWWWIAIRGVGFYALMFLAMIYSQYSVISNY